MLDFLLQFVQSMKSQNQSMYRCIRHLLPQPLLFRLPTLQFQTNFEIQQMLQQSTSQRALVRSQSL
jgi:hypothetical protein